jgi:uncharacterized integral membrane protein
LKSPATERSILNLELLTIEMDRGALMPNSFTMNKSAFPTFPMPIALRLFLLALLLLVAGVFLWQNLTPIVSLVLLGMKLPELPLALWIIAAFGIGFLISVVFSVLMHWRSGKRKRNAAGETVEPWDDEQWEARDRAAKKASGDADWSDRPLTQPQPPKKIVDAPFRVITPPIRNLDEEDV